MEDVVDIGAGHDDLLGAALDPTGAIRADANLPCRPDAFLQAVAPFRPDIVIGCECMFAWYWVADLCAEGWHVCLDALELAGLSETCAPAVAPALNNQVFFATRQHGSANGMCVAATAANSSNNIHGCGNFGTVESAAQSASCAPLVPFRLEQAGCFNIVGWACGTDPNSTTELNDATKPSSAAGGVLCCRD